MTTDVLKRPTLVLNRNWQPVHVTTVVRALVLLWNDAAKAIDPDDYRMYDWDEWTRLPARPDGPAVRAARARLRVPEVLALTHYDRLPTAAVAFSRRNVAKRDHHTCQYCGIQPGWERITVDHIVPRAQGGATTWTNCVAACAACNTRKADRTPDQAGMKLRHPPTRPAWKPIYADGRDRQPAWARFLAEPDPVLA